MRQVIVCKKYCKVSNGQTDFCTTIYSLLTYAYIYKTVTSLTGGDLQLVPAPFFTPFS